MKDFRKLREQAIRQQHRHAEGLSVGDRVMNAVSGEKGTIHRTGVNYVICVT